MDKAKIIQDYKDRFDDVEDDELHQLKSGLSAKEGSEIDIHDFAVGKIVKDKASKIIAYLVIEEDGSVNWYLNPDENSDTVVRSVYVKKIRER